MAADVVKHLERAKKYLERNKLQDAIEEYKAVLEIIPTSQEAMQALGDLYMRLNEPEKAAQYYGMIFDRFTELGDVAKASVLYTRFLKPVPQPPERMARYAVLLQRQSKISEAIEQYDAAAERYVAQHNDGEALSCWEKVAQLDFDNPARHVKLGEAGERLGKPEVASRGFLRAGQLALSGGELDRAIEFLERAHRLTPSERSVALFFAEALLRKGDAARAVSLLEPFSGSEADPEFLSIFGDALMHNAQFDRARGVLEQLYQRKPDNLEKLFELADQYVKAAQDKKGVEVLAAVKQRMLSMNRANEFAAQMDGVAEANPKSLPLLEFCGSFYNELNRESKYFNVLVRLFDLYIAAANFSGAADAFDRLVDIDAYDFRHHDRLKALEGKVDPDYLRGVSARMVKAATVGGQAPSAAPGTPAAPTAPVGEEARGRQSLEDMVVEAEIFLQYARRDKAIERLQKIAEMFPGEEERNERLRNLYSQASWWPAGAKPEAKPAPPAPPPSATVPPTSRTGIYSADTIRDLAKISEITRTIFRQSTPKAVLATAVNEMGKYLRATRCIAVSGTAGQAPLLAAEYCTPGTQAASGADIVKLLTVLGQMPPDNLGGVQLDPTAAPVLREMGLLTALGVQLVDKETQAAAGTLIVGDAAQRKWKQNETYFLQALGDQMLICVNHAKQRSLVRTLAVADEKTGLVGRSSYLDCLLAEANRSKTQNTPLSLVILTMDRGPEILRQHSEAMVERYMEQLARALLSNVRQNDMAVKYTAWALAFILPDTALAPAKSLTEKLRKVAAGVQPPWDKTPVTLSAAVVQSVGRPDYDSEDVVTDLVNRAEFGLEEARKKGGNTLVSL